MKVDDSQLQENILILNTENNSNEVHTIIAKANRTRKKHWYITKIDKICTTLVHGISGDIYLEPI